METAGWQNISTDDKICHLCRDGVGDEYHYLLFCKNEAAVELRQKYIPRYYHLNANIKKWVACYHCVM